MWDFLWRHADTLVVLFVLWGISFRLNAVARAQDHNFIEVLKLTQQATQSVHQSLGNIRADLDDIRRCPDCKAKRDRLAGGE